jgi:hypothetical protein
LNKAHVPERTRSAAELASLVSDSEIPAAIEKQFPMFRRLNVWPAIPELMEACEKEGLQSKSSLAKG